MGDVILGPFRLDAVLGRGAMGDVWRATHRTQGVPAAIKVVSSQFSRDRKYIEAFHAEVRAVASMHHPGIVMVLGVGEVSADAAANSDGKLEAGNPWLAMELASGGSLDSVPLPIGWSELKGILLSLLDAFGHAHARGVIHRDLKPGNILVSGAEDYRPGYKLTDFGIAHAKHEHVAAGSYEVTAGTPQYMAPEQIEGRFRDYGPWTDLYSLGILAYEFATGAPPFDHHTMVGMAMMHLNAPVPDMVFHHAVPPGFEGWVRHLLQKRPSHRFECAADAAWALIQLGDPDLPHAGSSASLVALPRQSSESTMLLHSPVELASGSFHTLARTGAPETDAGMLETLPSAPSLAAIVAAAKPAETPVPSAVAAPIPLYWKRPTTPRPPMQLVGAGLGLFGLRTVPMVGRIQERDALWAALRDVGEHRSARVVRLHGAAGVGKTRLTDWLIWRVQEVGAATVLRATHALLPGPGDGLSSMVAHHYGCVGLTNEETVERLTALLKEFDLDPYEALALSELIQPATEAERAARSVNVDFGSAAERYALVGRLVARAGNRRPVLMVIDEAQWGSDTLGLAEWLTAPSRAGRFPVLIVSVVRDESAASREAETARLATLGERADAVTVETRPLSADCTEVLVRQLLGLESHLVRELTGRCMGNPLFAVQLIGDWVARGLLRVTSEGFVLKDDATVELPDSIHEVWAQRLETVMGETVYEATLALELAAILGNEFSTSEWRRSSELAGFDIPDELVHRLATAKLIRPTRRGWEFSQEMVRESIFRLAREHGRWTWCHQISAHMLTDLYGDDIAVAERLGHHYHHAGEAVRAIGPLVQAARARIRKGQLVEADNILRKIAVCQSAEDLDPSDVRLIETQVIEATILEQRGDYDRTQLLISDAISAARRGGHEALEAEGILLMASVHRQRAEFGDAHEWLERAAAVEPDNAKVYYWWAEIERRQGRLDEALQLAAKARGLARKADNGVVGANSTIILARVHRSRGDLHTSARLYREAHASFLEGGARTGVAASLNGLGEIERTLGRLDDARRAYTEAAATYTSLGAADRIFPVWNMALVMLEQGRYDDAEPPLREALSIMDAAGRLAYAGFAHANLAELAAARQQFETCAKHLASAERLIAGGLNDPDIARSYAEVAKATARTALDICLEATRLAEAQWEALGEHEEVVSLRAAIAAAH